MEEQSWRLPFSRIFIQGKNLSDTFTVAHLMWRSRRICRYATRWQHSSEQPRG